ncbi:hypothetical protein E4O05_08200 [Treponema sp. OMZ 787]|uniref:hypothetical protein n=1 Tax=Treponema sp. OMZ 787 TaxID=2563669 RepID=UPI0020A27289|nr:hypothetical protein [Treponema sp. OMZ 787]UTC61533.1 hypothetical protein E4O05_08200 [Treponema sp. OMZ 787]
MKKFFNAGRVMYLLGIFVLSTAIVMNITNQFPLAGFLPVVIRIDFVINCICLFFCLILFIKPKNNILTYMMFFMEAGVTAHMGFVGIGTLLFAAGCVMVFVNGDFKTYYKQKIAALTIYWLLISIGLYFSFSIRYFIFEITLTGFYFGLLVCLYKKLEANLSYLLPPTEIVSTEINLPPKGSVLELEEYGISERQKDFILGSIMNGKTYEELSAEFHVSTSVVKKDMASACKSLGVANREALRILLLQYRIE